MHLSRRSKRLALAAVLLALPVAALSVGCSSTIPARDPTGEPFPSVVGESLAQVEVRLPSEYAGAPAVLLVGYLQETQFDIDRWLMGLLQAGVAAPLVEIPTIPGLLPSFASGWIDDGMRSGIPEEDWGAVVTLYGKAAKPVAELTGTERGRNARVLVLDAAGEVIWFHDRGYSAGLALAVAELVAARRGDEPVE